MHRSIDSAEDKHELVIGPMHSLRWCHHVNRSCTRRRAYCNSSSSITGQTHSTSTYRCQYQQQSRVGDHHDERILLLSAVCMQNVSVVSCFLFPRPQRESRGQCNINMFSSPVSTPDAFFDDFLFSSSQTTILLYPPRTSQLVLRCGTRVDRRNIASEPRGLNTH